MPQAYEDDGRPILGCPLRRVPDWAWQLIGLFPHYQNGFLPVAGGLGDQPYTYVWAMAVIGSEVGKIEQEHRQQEQRQAEARQRQAGRR